MEWREYDILTKDQWLVLFSTVCKTENIKKWN